MSVVVGIRDHSGVAIAADQQSTIGEVTRTGLFSKLIRHRNLVGGCCGPAIALYPLRALLESLNGSGPIDAPRLHKLWVGAFQRFGLDKIIDAESAPRYHAWFLITDGRTLLEVDPCGHAAAFPIGVPAVIGCDEYALGALHALEGSDLDAGSRARIAVEATARYSPRCSGTETLVLPRGPRVFVDSIWEQG